MRPCKRRITTSKEWRLKAKDDLSVRKRNKRNLLVPTNPILKSTNHEIKKEEKKLQVKWLSYPQLAFSSLTNKSGFKDMK
jgi:hypothetical protein